MLRAPCLAIAAALFATVALAGPGPAPDTPSPAASAPQSEPGALSDEEMRHISGGQEVLLEVSSVQTLTGSSSGNSVTAHSYVSGDVSFSAEALSGFTGIGNFVINTGANNTLQGSINVSVATVPAP